MKTFIAGQDISITVPFRWDGEPFVPDGGAASYDLRGQDGSLVHTAVAISNITDTETVITIAAVDNQVAAGLQFEKRQLVFHATFNGSAWTHRINYRIAPWLNFTASAEDVRAFVGVGSGELADKDIDLVSAYFDCVSYMDDANTVFEQALASGGDLERQANRAIVAQAVILAMPSLQARISKSDDDGNMSVERFQLDLADLESRASDQLSRAINTITGRNIETPALTTFASDLRDPFRGRCHSWRYW